MAQVSGQPYDTGGASAKIVSEIKRRRRRKRRHLDVKQPSGQGYNPNQEMKKPGVPF